MVLPPVLLLVPVMVGMCKKLGSETYGLVLPADSNINMFFEEFLQQSIVLLAGTPSVAHTDCSQQRK